MKKHENEIEKRLYRFSLVKHEIRQLNNSIAELFETIDGERNVKAMVYDLPSLSPTNDKSDPTYQKAQKIIDIYEKEIDRIEKQLEKLLEEQRAIEKMVYDNGLELGEIQLIELWYFKKYKSKMVAEELNYSIRQVYNIKDSILGKIRREYVN